MCRRRYIGPPMDYFGVLDIHMELMIVNGEQPVGAALLTLHHFPQLAKWRIEHVVLLSSLKC